MATSDRAPTRTVAPPEKPVGRGCHSRPHRGAPGDELGNGLTAEGGQRILLVVTELPRLPIEDADRAQSEPVFREERSAGAGPGKASPRATCPCR